MEKESSIYNFLKIYGDKKLISILLMLNRNVHYLLINSVYPPTCKRKYDHVLWEEVCCTWR